MKEDSKLVKSMWRTLSKNLIILITLAVVGFVGTWSWFTNSTKATASGLYVTCEAPDGVEIAVVEHNAPAPPSTAYSTNVLLDEATFFSKLVMSEVTSDGITFTKPKLNQLNGQALPDTTKEWDTALAGTEYICFDLYIRTRRAKPIYISSESTVNPSAEHLKWDSGEGTGNNPSTSGSFSKDCLVGATRVSILNADETKENRRKLLWLPRPDIFLSQQGANYSVITGLREADNSYGTYFHNYWQMNGSNPVEVVRDEEAIASVIDDTAKVKLGQNVEITKFDPNEDSTVTNDDDYVYSHVVVNMWVEGEDKEARLALAGGKFELNLKLISKQTM